LNDRLTAQFAFLNEADKLKQVLRATTLVDASRPENSGEHSWHLALYAMVLADQAGCRNVPPEGAARPKGRKRFRPRAPFASWQEPSAIAPRPGEETRCVSCFRPERQSLAPDREDFPGMPAVGLLFQHPARSPDGMVYHRIPSFPSGGFSAMTAAIRIPAQGDAHVEDQGCQPRR
jgi:hypothetical protein